MPAVWTYPWSLFAEGIDAACARLAECGVDALSVASHYHSIRTLQPRLDTPQFVSYPGGCYFQPDRTAFDSIVPPINDIEGSEDPLADIAETAADYGLTVSAWCVCFHNTRLGDENPEYRTQSAFGQHHDHSFCPSHPEVQTYLAEVINSLAEYSIDAINLESLGFQSVFHSHGVEFGHDKNQAVRGQTAEMLFSQCFCSACQRRARDHSVDFDHAASVVRDLCQKTTSRSTQGTLADLVENRPVLRDLFDFRAAVIEDVVAALAAVSDDVALDYSVSDGFGREPDNGWPAGVDIERLEPHLDRLTALCYVDDPEQAGKRVRAFRDRFDLPVSASVSLDPTLVDTRETWDETVAQIRETSTDVVVYNHGLLTDEQMGWLRDSFAYE